MEQIRIIYILCVCWGNHDRSPLIAGMLRTKLATRGIHAIVESCGTTDSPREGEFAGASSFSIDVLAKRDIDISKHCARRARDIDLTGWHLYAVVSPETRDELAALGIPRENIWVLNESEGGIPNPWQQGYAAYEACAECVRRALEPLVEHVAHHFDEIVES